MKLVIAEKPSVAVILNVNMFKGKEYRKTEELYPQCGSVLIEGNIRFGKFIACSNYPKCKYQVY